MDGGGEDLARCDDLKLRTARTIKWNVIDRVSSQVLYAVTGIVLARLLSQEDFGLVGAILVFQAFASLMVDSGFSYALLQRKSPTREDYSSVLWFNMAVAVGICGAMVLRAVDSPLFPGGYAPCAAVACDVLYFHIECFGHSADQPVDEADGCVDGGCLECGRSGRRGCRGDMACCGRVWRVGDCMAECGAFGCEVGCAVGH